MKVKKIATTGPIGKPHELKTALAGSSIVDTIAAFRGACRRIGVRILWSFAIYEAGFGLDFPGRRSQTTQRQRCSGTDRVIPPSNRLFRTIGGGSIHSLPQKS
jgi:hypothetical protein